MINFILLSEVELCLSCCLGARFRSSYRSYRSSYRSYRRYFKL